MDPAFRIWAGATFPFELGLKNPIGFRALFPFLFAPCYLLFPFFLSFFFLPENSVRILLGLCLDYLGFVSSPFVFIILLSSFLIGLVNPVEFHWDNVDFFTCFVCMLIELLDQHRLIDIPKNVDTCFNTQFGRRRRQGEDCLKISLFQIGWNSWRSALLFVG